MRDHGAGREAGASHWNLLFVVNAGHIENGLRRMLHGFRGAWRLRFCSLADLPGSPDLKWADVVTGCMEQPDEALEVIQIVRRHAVARELPVLIVTEGTASDHKKQALNLGVTDFLDKPVRPENLVSRISTAIRLRALSKEAPARVLAEGRSEDVVSALRYKALVETSVSAIAVVDPNNRLSYANLAFARMWGYGAPEDVSGKAVSDLWRRRFRHTGILDTLQDKMNWQGELVGIRKDGSEFEVYVSAGMVRGQGWQPLCMMATFVDMSERKRAERDLLRARAALDGSTDAVAMTDSLGRPVYVNSSYESVTGCNLASLQKAGLASVYADEDVAREMLATVRGEGHWYGEINMRTSAGGELPVLLRGNVVYDSDNQAIGSMLVHTDIVAHKAIEQQLSEQNQRLEQEVSRRTSELEHARLDMVWRLAKAGEFRDEDTGNHVIRVGFYCRLMAERLGLNSALAERLLVTAPLHDIGKIGIPDGILLKPGRLTAQERQTMQSHCEIGAQILAQNVVPDQRFARWYRPVLKGHDSARHNELLLLAEEIARNHHERWDGKGYPRRLSEDKIPVAARIVAIADVYDALCSERPYKPAYAHEEGLAMLADGRATQFDPDVLDTFLMAADDVLSISREFPD